MWPIWMIWPPRGAGMDTSSEHGIVAVMQEKWISNAAHLPSIGESIEFLVEGRQQSIHGTFANGIFHSRWADYDASRVTTWRRADGTRQSEKTDGSNATQTRVFATTLKRFTWS